MTGWLERIAPALTQAWVGWYTNGLPGEIRAVRRAEVDSDLHDHQRDAQDGGEGRLSIALEIVRRLVLGVPDDLGWRRETLRQHHGTAIEGRIGTMSITTNQMRWMSVCGVVSGALLIGARLVPMVMGTESGRAEPGVFVLLVSALALLGVLGLYLQHRGSVGWTGRVGAWLMLAGWAGVLFGFGVATIVRSGSVLALAFLPVNLGFLIGIPLGFLLLGIGLPSPTRRVPLVVGCYLVAVYAAGLVPGVPRILLGNEAQTIMWGIGLAGIGIAVWSGTRTGTRQPDSPARV